MSVMHWHGYPGVPFLCRTDGNNKYFKHNIAAIKSALYQSNGREEDTTHNIGEIHSCSMFHGVLPWTGFKRPYITDSTPTPLSWKIKRSVVIFGRATGCDCCFFVGAGK